MPVLKNARHEKFAQLIAQGKTKTESYELAGYKPDRHAASRMSTKINITERVNELLRIASQRVTVTIADVVNELAKLGFSNMGDYLDTDLSLLTRDQLAALSEVTVDDRKVRFKLYDKRAALVDLGKHLGAFREAEAHAAPTDIRINVNFINPDGSRAKTIEHKS